MANVVKVAQPGYDVKTTGDENLVYSSEWPLLPIYQQGPVTVKDVSKSQILMIHDLTFNPLYWFFSNATITGWEGLGPSKNERRAEFFGPISGGSIGINTNQLLYTPPVGGVSGSLNLYCYIFALDLAVQYNAPIINIGDIRGASDPSFVFKLAKEGRDINSHNLDDFIIHSRARSPLVHSVNPSVGVVKNLVINHNLGYLPMFFGYIKSNGYYVQIPTGQGGSSSFLSDENNITFNDTGGKEISIVVLKDPFNTEYSRKVTV